MEGIAAEASVSLQAFYEHFSGKEDAFLVAYEIGHDKALALVEQAYRSQADWRLGVRAGIAALFRFMAGEPAYAHMAMVDVLAATDRTAERAFKGAGSYSQMLLPGLDYSPDGGSARRASPWRRSRGACSSCACTTRCRAARTSSRRWSRERRTSR